jgi:hypothetical protein
MAIEKDLKNLLSTIENQEVKAKRRLYIYSVLPILAALVLLYFFYSRINSSRVQLNELTSKINILNDSLAEREKSNVYLKHHIDSLNNIYKNLNYSASADFGWSPEDVINPDSSKLSNSKTAHKEIMRLIDLKKVSVNITIRYYTKSEDRGKVDRTLMKCGYRTIIVDKDFYRSHTSTNAIYFSKEIDINNIKLIAYALIRAGLNVKVIKSYPKTIASQKPNSIEISHDARYSSVKTISLDEIKNATSF